MTETVEDAKKKQLVRLFDVLVFAPILIWVAMKGNLNKTMRWILIVLALGTIIYNGYYLIKYSRK